MWQLFKIRKDPYGKWQNDKIVIRDTKTQALSLLDISTVAEVLSNPIARPQRLEQLDPK